MKPPLRIDVSRQELEDVLARVRETLGEQDYEKLKAAIETLAYLTDSLQDREISLQRLRKILFGASSEKTRDVTPASNRTPQRNRSPRRKRRRRSHALVMVAMQPRHSEERRKSKSHIPR